MPLEGPFFNQGRLATVARWLDGLPREVVLGNPRLCVARAWLVMDIGRLDLVDPWVRAAEGGMRVARPRDAAGSLATETAVLRVVHCFKIGSVGQAVTSGPTESGTAS